MLFTRTLSDQQKVNFSKNLSVMLRSGISINVALTALEEQEEAPHFKEIISSVRDGVEKGTPLSTAFSKDEKSFGPVFISLVRAGEKSGTLQENLYFLSDWFERSADLNREIRTATMYPKLVFGAATLLGGALAVFILPKLVPMFSQMNVTLPIITKILLAISVFVQDYWPFVLLFVIAFIATFLYVSRIPRIERVLHFMYVRIPFIGRILKGYQLALTTQLFSILLKSGLTINQSIEIVAGAVTNIQYRESLEGIQNEVVKGTQLSAAMEKHETLFPRMVINIISIGEQSGTLSDSFAHLAEYYTKEVNSEAKKLPTIIEPILLILIALMVGFVALAIIMPIYELTGSAGR